MKFVKSYSVTTSLSDTPVYSPFLCGPVSTHVIEYEAFSVSSAAGTVSEIVITLSAAPGLGKSRIITLRINEVDTAAVIIISDLNTSGRYTGTPISVARGDRLTLSWQAVNSPAICQVGWQTYAFISSISKLSIYSSPMMFQLSNAFVDRFNGVFDSYGLLTEGTETAVKNVSPTAGAITGYNLLGVISNGFWEGYVVLVKNGVVQDGTGGTVDTRTDITIQGVAGSLTHASKDFSLTVARGDNFSTKMVNENPNGDAFLAMCFNFVATIDGESIMASNYPNIEAAFTRYGIYANPDEASYSNTDNPETSMQSNQLGGITSFLLGKWIASLDAGPGSGGDGWTFTGRTNQADTELQMTVLNAETTCGDLIHGMVIADGDIFSFSTVPLVTPTSARVRYAIVQFISQTPGPSTPGIFVPTPGQHNDTFNQGSQVAIPTPFFRTAYLGE